MDSSNIVVLSSLIFLTAILYSSVGQGGGSGYLAVMALYGLAPGMMKPIALILNIVVSSIATVKYYRAGHFQCSTFIPFALASIPMAFIGGIISLPGHMYKPIVGVVLIFVGFLLFVKIISITVVRKPPFLISMVSGAGIGLLSGLTGVGGGIFLSPLLIFKGWAEPKKTLGISAGFILVNSISGILGHFSSVKSLPGFTLYFAICAVIGGIIGSQFGTRKFANETLQRILAILLFIAGLKMIFSILN